MSEANRWEFKKVKLEDAKLMDNNPRTISKKAVSGLKASLSRFGYVEPIIWNERTGHVVGGHQRYSVLKAQGVKEATMVVVNFDETEELAANLTLNNPEIEGDWDDPIGDLLGQIQDNNEDLYSALNMDDLKASVDKSSGGDDKGGGKDWDTECPCCANKWVIQPDDVQVEEED
jgi:hypothetical protein